MRKLLLCVLLLFPNGSNCQSCDFKKALNLIFENYPNYPKTITQRDFLIDAQKILVLSNYDTFIALNKIINQFNDPHLALVEVNCIRGLKTSRSRGDVTRNSSWNGPIKLGFYTNEYRTSIIEVVSSSTGSLEGYIVKSIDPKLINGFQLISATRESPYIYYGSYIDEFSKKRRAGRIEFRSSSEFTTGAYAKWTYIHDTATFDFDLAPLQNLISFPNDKISIIRLPCASSECKMSFDSLIDQYDANIRSRDILIIDLRRNVGGQSAIINRLLPYVYTGPIGRHSSSLYVTADDIASAKAELRSLRSQQMEDTVANMWLEWITRLKSNIGGFIPDIADSIYLERTVKQPRQVHVLIDYSNQSAAELMILMLMQSKKVIVWGERTHGAIDYLDYAPHRLVSDNYYLYIPKSRRTIGEYGVKLDGVGIYPDRTLVTQNWIEYLIQHIQEAN